MHVHAESIREHRHAYFVIHDAHACPHCKHRSVFLDSMSTQVRAPGCRLAAAVRPALPWVFQCSWMQISHSSGVGSWGVSDCLGTQHMCVCVFSYVCVCVCLNRHVLLSAILKLIECSSLCQNSSRQARALCSFSRGMDPAAARTMPLRHGPQNGRKQFYAQGQFLSCTTPRRNVCCQLHRRSPSRLCQR